MCLLYAPRSSDCPDRETVCHPASVWTRNGSFQLKTRGWHIQTAGWNGADWPNSIPGNGWTVKHWIHPHTIPDWRDDCEWKVTESLTHTNHRTTSPSLRSPPRPRKRWIASWLPKKEPPSRNFNIPAPGIPDCSLLGSLRVKFPCLPVMDLKRDWL